MTLQQRIDQDVEQALLKGSDDPLKPDVAIAVQAACHTLLTVVGERLDGFADARPELKTLREELGS